LFRVSRLFVVCDFRPFYNCSKCRRAEGPAFSQPRATPWDVCPTSVLYVGPTGQPFVINNRELLVRWTDCNTKKHEKLCVATVPQGVALGWVNRCPFGAHIFRSPPL
jgi:hypothetical protein